MNKLMMTFVTLLITVPAIAMELVVITEKEHKDFLSRLSQKVEFSNKLFEEGRISDQNPVHIALNELSKKMSTHGNNLGKVLKSDETMSKSVYNIKENSNKRFINDISDTIAKDSRNVEMARIYKIRARHILSDIMFKKNCVYYALPKISGIDVDDCNNIEPLLRNKHPEFVAMICRTTSEEEVDYLVQNNNTSGHVLTDLKHHKGIDSIRGYMGLLVYKMLFAYLDLD